MKKIFLGTGVLLLSVATLAACGNSKDTSTKADNSSSSSVQKSSESSSKVEESIVNKENLNQAAKQLEEKFNDKEKLVKVNVRNDVADSTSDVADSTSDVAHSVIEVKVIDEESRKSMSEMQNAIDSNSATDVQKNAISGIQLNIEEVAKTLENEHDVIEFVVPDTNGNRDIAMATKNENIIPIVE